MPKDLGYSGSGKVNSPAKNSKAEISEKPMKSGEKGGLVHSAAKSALEAVKKPMEGGSKKAPLD